MKRHQVLTGSANPGNHCYSVGRINDFTFWAYGSGCDLVISCSSHEPIQIIASKNDVTITALDCTETNGNIAVAYGNTIEIFSPKLLKESEVRLYAWNRTSSFAIGDSLGDARILSWNYMGNQLLVGSSVISLWSLQVNSNATTESVSFQITDERIAESQTDSSWFHCWSSGLDEKPVVLSFSPNTSVCPLFASIATGECMIKVWYSRQHRKKSSSWFSSSTQSAHGFDNIAYDFTFTYLMHPQPVIGFEWRKNFVLDGNERFSNTLISSCQDQICRIWCETKQPVSGQLKFQATNASSIHRKRKKEESETDSAKRAASTPAFSNLDMTFTNPLIGNCMHQDVRHFHIAASINPISDIPLLPAFTAPNQVTDCSDDNTPSVFTVHWLNNKYHQMQMMHNKCTHPAAETERVIESISQHDHKVDVTSETSEGHEHGSSFTGSSLEKLLNNWRESRDALYSIHPSDGSLLMWHIDWLDEDRAGKICQPQVCFSSRIPLAFSSGDAATLCPRMILFVNYTTEQNILHSTSYMSFQSKTTAQELQSRTIFSSVQLLSKHHDGSLNLWQITFTDTSDFASITSISHSARFCGHCFHLSGILSHPLLPLMVTTASHQTSTCEPKQSELILWRMDPIGPLSYSGGLSELARVGCKKDHLFNNVAWFPVLFPSWCLGIENNSPSTALIALSENKLQVYQVVVDASKILTDILSPMTPVESFDVLQQSLVSQQSSAHPGCLLHLSMSKDLDRPWGKIVFLETFPSNIMETGSKESHMSMKFHKPYFVVMLEQSDDKAWLHTWSITFSANMASVHGARSRRTTVQMSDSSEEESEEENREHSPTVFSHVNVHVNKLCKQQLVFPENCNVVSACSWAGRFTLLFASEQENHLYPAPYHLCTACDNGSMYFWSCTVSQNKETAKRECDWHLLKSYSTTTLQPPECSIALRGKPIMIKAANPTLLACLSIVNFEDVVVTVYECASSGGSIWKEQDVIEFSAFTSMDSLYDQSFHLDWLSQEEGSFFLVVGVSTHLQIYALTPRDPTLSNSKTKRQIDDGLSPTKHRMIKQHSLDLHTRQKLASSKLRHAEEGLKFHDQSFQEDTEMGWKLMHWSKLADLDVCQSVETCKTSQQGQKHGSSNHVTVSWARDGMLVVASTTEMHVFSQWMPDGKSNQYAQNPKNSQDTQVDGELVIGLSELVDKLCPSLPQYHPHVLSELLNSGHLDVVRSVLIHLSICMNGDYRDTTCCPEVLQYEKFQFSEQLCSLGSNVTPLSLFELLGPDGKIRSNLDESKNEQVTKEQSKANTEELLEDFFMDMDKEEDHITIDDELDEILGIKASTKKGKKSDEKIDLTKLEPNYFGKEHCHVIHEFLIHNQLPGLSSFDQMELMALADTLELTNASNLKHSTSETSYTDSQGAMGLTAGERGYAVSGGGAGALDNCGLRYVMALHNHLCLLNSLPASNRAALLKQGLNTCHFAWAFHSEAEEEILSLLPSVQRRAPEWTELQAMGAGWWIRSTVLLRKLVEQTARAAFLKNNEPLDAALFYLALNKKSVLCGLFRSVKDSRMLQFFQHNFAEDRWRRAALKNAFALMGKQRFQEAAAFFLLSGSVQDAVEVCIEKMKDIQLALTICRLRENTDVTHHQLLQVHVLGDAENPNGVKQPHSDGFLRSMAYWIIGKYDLAVSTLLHKVKYEDITDIFNFYIYLRSHPILLRNTAQMTGAKGVASFPGTKSGTLIGVNNEERQLIFMTAVVHLEAGCPLLALDSLSKLPKLCEWHEPSVAVQSVDEPKDRHIDVIKEEKKSVDWSQPIDIGGSDELELDWSDEEDESEEHDIVPVVTNIPSLDPEPVEQSTAAEKPNTKHDVFAHHLRMTACFKIFVQEVKAISYAYCSDGGLLRSKLYVWLENASNVFHRIFGLNEFDVDESLKPSVEKPHRDDSSSDNEDSTSMGSISGLGSINPPPSLHELILADNHDWKSRRIALLRRRKWLQRHHNFLRTLLSYCNLHDSAFCSLATMRMELLLLLQESLQDRTSTHSLSSPLPHPSENIPLITSVVAMCKTVVADPLTHLSHMTKDILRSAFVFTSAPHPKSATNYQETVLLCSQASTLSSCIYQSLCDTSTPSYHSQLLKADGVSVGSFDACSLGHSPSQVFSTSYLQQTPLHPSAYVAPTTLPTQWPGVAVLQSMLNAEISHAESRTKIIILLCEATTAVYISLLIHALHTNNTALMYRLTNHNLGSKMWNAVFGGGVKLHVKYAKSRLSVDQQPSLSGGHKIRDRLNHKLLHPNDRKTSIASSGGQEQSAYREKFVPPETSLWDWFLTKPFMAPLTDEGLGFDSDAESDDSSSVTSFGSTVDDMEDFDVDPDGNEQNEQDNSNSYSWKLMRLGVVETAANNLQSFISLAGFDLNELSSNSPLLCAMLQLLQQWRSELVNQVDECGGPPSGFLPSLKNANYVAATSGSPAQRPAMLKYRVMLEANNTPFDGSSKECMGCKRLWHSLVKKENLQEMFIKYIFHRKATETVSYEYEGSTISVQENDDAEIVSTKSVGEFGGKVKILHKESDLLAAFCINKVNSNCIALASAKDIQELDLSTLLAADNWTWVDDLSSQSSGTVTHPNDEDFLFVSVPNKTPKVPPVFLPGSHSAVPWSSTSQTGQGANILMKRPVGGVRRMESHPTLPYYLTGNRDGGVCMWEWGHQQQISQYQTPGQFAKVSNVHFSAFGNKISSVDADGYLMMWQVSNASKPFLRHLCHDRGVNDCCFISSASVVATAGLSSTNKNVAIWDTLMPKRSILVKDFTTHETTGAYCIQYMPRYRTLLVGGKNGQVSVFDDRCLHGPVNRFAAHESSVKCLAMDPQERFYVTGSASGAVKVWDALTHKLKYVSNHEHARSSLFRNFGSGTVQVIATEEHLLTCGADGSLKMKTLPDSDYWR
uniref:DmX-like protein 1 n=1 Tax=Phallusia mammillata TaxID=59560 RepID=A0A6F9DBU9_9ASCI|nr:dmX-like protein 1 [Phallusia mammillata]